MKQKKKHQDISSFYKGVPKIMIRWCMVPEKPMWWADSDKCYELHYICFSSNSSEFFYKNMGLISILV